jgi:hypothetical protein
MERRFWRCNMRSREDRGLAHSRARNSKKATKVGKDKATKESKLAKWLKKNGVMSRKRQRRPWPRARWRTSRSSSRGVDVIGAGGGRGTNVKRVTGEETRGPERSREAREAA